jgi:NodT family efflux transporter outer membrane factor (OMF) lipoprotein
MKNPSRNILYTLIAILFTGCSVGPDYKRPPVDTPTAYKEAQGWKIAEPQDDAPRGNWWGIYGDPELNVLISQVEVSNQNVLVAKEQYYLAQGILDQARAGYFPILSAGPSSTRGQGTISSSPVAPGAAIVSPGAPIRTTDRMSFTASWEADIWGQIGRNVEANDAAVVASAADLQAALLSYQSTLVQSYMQLRINDAQRQLLDQTIVVYKRSLQITQDRYEAGVAARLDVAQADTQLKSAQAQALDLGIQRAQLEHAIAVLVGKTPADFELKPIDAIPNVPQIPVGLPSKLLERRPDIAGAERRMASANALIGVAQSAFFPALTMSASGGYLNSSFSQLLTLPHRFWSIGPSLALTVFDGGARSAQKAQAIATYNKNVATYRQTVLAAFQQVEDNLIALRILEEEGEAQQAAARLAAEAWTLTDNQYKSGTVSYLNVVTAQATALSTAKSSLDITSRRLVASAALLTALGGDWRTPESPSSTPH